MQINKLIPIAALLMFAACDSDASVDVPPPNGAVMTVIFASHTADTMHVVITDTTTIAAADAFIHSGNGPHMVTGEIVRGAGIDTLYPLKFDPETVRLTDSTATACDVAPMRSTAAVDSLFAVSADTSDATRATWCPSDSRPVAIQLVTIQ